MKKILYFLLLIFFCACSNTTEKAQETVSSLYSTVCDTTLRATDFYPLFDSLHVKLRSDVLDMSNEIDVNNDTLYLSCLNSYTDERGKFCQDSIYFFIHKDKDSGKYYIVDSKGLINIDESIQNFGVKIGAIKKGKSYNDLELVHRIKIIGQIYLEQYFKFLTTLMTGVEIKKWSWETDYSGDARGEAQIINNLPYNVHDIKYKVTYYDYNGSYMTEDTGIACRILHPNEKYFFSFWSSHAKNPSKANLKLEFSDSMIGSLMESQDYSSNEYEEYVEKMRE